MNKPFTQFQTLEKLRRQVSAIENERIADGETLVSNGSAAVDRVLPAGGYRKGTLTDWIAPAGCGADFLSMRVAQEAARDGGAIVVVDPDRQFFPIAAAALGLPMEKLIVLQSSADRRGRGDRSNLDQDLLWAIDQALHCPAVAAVWGPLPAVDDRWSRRFQLSAESSGCLGLFVRPLVVAQQPSWSEVQWLVSPAKAIEGADPNLFFTELQMVRCRGSHTGQSILLSVNTVTGSVRKARSEHEYRRFNHRITHSNRSTAATNGIPSGINTNSCATSSQTDSVPVASGVANPAAGRRRA